MLLVNLPMVNHKCLSLVGLQNRLYCVVITMSYQQKIKTDNFRVRTCFITVYD